MEFLYCEPFEVKFIFQRNSLKYHFPSYNHKDKFHYGSSFGGSVLSTSTSAPANVSFGFGTSESHISKVTDDKNFCTWTAELIDGGNNILKLKVQGAPEDKIKNLKLFKKKCEGHLQCLNVTYDYQLKIWSSSNVCSTDFIHSQDCSSVFLDIILRADYFAPEALKSNMSKSVAEMFTEGKYTDVILTVQDQKFRAHKAILMEKSPVFEAMFLHKETKENVEGIVDIKEAEPEAVKNLLIYMYSGIIVDPIQIPGLYLIGDRYQIGDLKEICLRKIKNGFCFGKDTLMTSFIVAGKLEDDDLKKKCLDFVRKNREVATLAMSTKEWATIIYDYPSLGETIAKTLAENDN